MSGLLVSQFQFFFKFVSLLLLIVLVCFTVSFWLSVVVLFGLQQEPPCFFYCLFLAFWLSDIVVVWAAARNAMLFSPCAWPSVSVKKGLCL